MARSFTGRPIWSYMRNLQAEERLRVVQTVDRETWARLGEN
jgi:hypothetical protein